MATKKCMKCGGSMSKYAKGGQALNKAKGFAKPATGGSNVSNKIYGVPNAGPTGPNMQGIDTMKKGGATKTKKALPKAQDGLNWANGAPARKIKALEPTGAKIGVGSVLLGAAGMGVKAIADKVKKIRAKKAEEEKKKKETTKAKFGTSVSVKESCKKGMVRGVDGKCVMERPKFKSGGSTFGMLSVKAGIDKNPKPTAADRIAGAKMKKK